MQIAFTNSITANKNKIEPYQRFITTKLIIMRVPVEIRLPTRTLILINVAELNP